MRIALLHPHSAPLAIGGAENLVWGLQDHLRAEGHICEIVSVAGRENSVVDVVAGYLAFAGLDLGGYDLVISGKYPAFAAAHDRHVVWMLHRLRGLYDTYAGGDYSPGLLAHPEVAAARRELARLHRSGALAGTNGLRDLLGLVHELEARAPPEFLAFPGPFARDVVHALDDAALAPGRIERYAAISRTVAKRTGYFPRGCDVRVLYPPPHRYNHRCGGQHYFFTSSRLDEAKRIRLLIEAVRRTETNVPLLIAGAGPEEGRLRELAGDDPRVRFLGFVPDEEMSGLYADALAVPFVPYDEDYGLVAIEAMRSAKPVLTVADAGGPTEFVIDGVTGRVVAPEPAAIAAALDALAGDRVGAAAMGEAARKAVAGVTWQAVSRGLLHDTPFLDGSTDGVGPRRARRRRFVVATTFPVFPPRGGGQSRVYHLYRNLARNHDVDVVSLAPAGTASGVREIAPGLIERRVARSALHESFERELATALGGVPVGDVASARLYETTPTFARELTDAAAGADVLVACHPFLYRALSRVAPRRPIWYEAQDVEHALKSDSYGRSPAAARLLSEVADLEAQAWRTAQVVFACADSDLDALSSLYGSSLARLCTVPNGVDVDAVPFVSPAERRTRRDRAGIGPRPIALFIGSWHPPNIDAVETVFAVAEGCPGVEFLVVGSVCAQLKDERRPGNVRLLGVVEDAVRDYLYGIADVALNPMRFGSGTNLKMLDYFAAGIAVLSTPFGARGLLAQSPTHFVSADVDAFACVLEDLVTRDDASRDAMVRDARALVERDYTWAGIAERFLANVAHLLP